MILFLFSLFSAQATGLHSDDIACPIGQNDSTKVFYVLASNEYGGYDSDGATYSSGMQFRNYEISTCTTSMYSALGSDMKKTWSPEEEAEIQTIIEKTKSSFTKPQLPEIWERYDIAINIYRWQGKTPDFLADLYMKAAWSARDEAVGIHEDLNGPKSADQVLMLGAKELEKELTPEQEKLVTFNLARVAHRNARFAKRDFYIQQFLARTDLSPAERQAGERFIELSTTIEPQYLKKAATELEKHIKTTNDGQSLYLLGDIYRRLGDMDRCRHYFLKANLTSDLQPEQHEIMQYLLQAVP